MVIPPVEIAESDVRRHSNLDRFNSLSRAQHDSDETTGRLY